MKSHLAVERMSDRMLWQAARGLVSMASPRKNFGPLDLQYTLDRLDAVLNEIQLRGQQLELVPAPPPGPPHESA